MSFLEEVQQGDYRRSGRTLEQGIALVREFLSVRPPVVVALNGGATGLGATLALLGDSIVMADSARIADTHVKVGIVAGDGGTLLWLSRVGMARAKEFLLTGDMVDAQTALTMGLVNRVVPKDEVLDTALGLGRTARGRTAPGDRLHQAGDERDAAARGRTPDAARPGPRGPHLPTAGRHRGHLGVPRQAGSGLAKRDSRARRPVSTLLFDLGAQ